MLLLRARSHKINPNVWKRFIEIHNQFHVGSGTSYLDLLMEASRMESMWRADCQSSGMSNLNQQCR